MKEGSAEEVYRAEVDIARGRGRSNKRWTKVVKELAKILRKVKWDLYIGVVVKLLIIGKITVCEYSSWQNN